MEQQAGYSETYSKVFFSVFLLCLFFAKCQYIPLYFFQGKSVIGKHFGFLKTSKNGKASSEKSGVLM